jgi:hypothetical protein
MAGGRALWVIGGVLAGLSTAAGLSLSDSEMVPDQADPPDAEGGRDDPSDGTTLPDGGIELSSRGYEVGDCVTWDPTGPFAVTDVVACTEPHRIQISGSVAAPDQDGYPTFDQWTTIIDETCAASAAALLGAPLDPDGRLHIEAIQPQPEGWSEGDRVVWCGLGTWGETVDPASLLHEDARSADQAYHFEAGQCVAYPPAAQAMMVVPCTQPHQMEIIGRIDYTDQAQVPLDEPDVRCHDVAVAYLGGEPQAPWAYSDEGLSPESWASGRRFSHCFVGQWSPDGSLSPVSVSIRG